MSVDRNRNPQRKRKRSVRRDEPAKKERESVAETKEGKSIGWVITMAMILIAVFGWGTMASGYAESLITEEEKEERLEQLAKLPRRSRGLGLVAASLSVFFWNMLAQLPNLPWAIAYTVKNRFGVIVVVAVLEGLTFLGGRQLKKLEQEMRKEDAARDAASPPRRKKKKRTRRQTEDW